MIHRLRRRHRATWLALAVLLPILYAMAIRARRPAPVMPSLPAPLVAVSGEETPP